jgi:hypothetical protein
MWEVKLAWFVLGMVAGELMVLITLALCAASDDNDEQGGE